MAPSIRSLLALTSLAATLALVGCGGSSTQPATATAPASESTQAALIVTDAWVKATEGPMTGVFARIDNASSAEVTITGVSTGASSMAEMHETVMEAGAMTMREKEDGFTLAANGSLVLEPGGNHIMVMGLSKPISPGDEVSVTLTLGSGSTVTFTAVAKDFSGGNETYVPSESMS